VDVRHRHGVPRRGRSTLPPEREFFVDFLLVRIHFIIVMIWWTGLAPWEFEFPFPGSLTTLTIAGLGPGLGLAIVMQGQVRPIPETRNPKP